MKKAFFLLFIFTSLYMNADSKYKFADLDFGSSQTLVKETISKNQDLSFYREEPDGFAYRGTLFNNKSSLVVFTFYEDKLACVTVLFFFIDIDEVENFYCNLENVLSEKYGDPSFSAQKSAKEKYPSLSLTEILINAGELYSSIWDPSTDKYESQLSMQISFIDEHPYIKLRYYSTLEDDRIQNKSEKAISIF